jgi:hypothetical protein
VGSSGPIAASSLRRHTDVPGMRPALLSSNPPPQQHTSSSRLPRSSSMLASPHASDVGAPGSTITAQVIVPKFSICHDLRVSSIEHFSLLDEDAVELTPDVVSPL